MKWGEIVVNKIVKIVKNIGLITMTILAAEILIVVLVTFGLSSVPGLFQLQAGTLAAGWLTLFALANMEIDEKKERPSKTITRTHQSHY